jgi:hypothetical protein
MLDRREFLRASGAGLAGLVSSAYALAEPPRPATPTTPQTPQTPQIKYPQKLVYTPYTRENAHLKKAGWEAFLFTYDEWQDFQKFRDARMNEKYPSKQPRLHALEIKAHALAKITDIDFSFFMTKGEVNDYNSELSMFNRVEDPIQINQIYGLNLTPDEFVRNQGAMIVWSLNRHYSYHRSEEIYRSQRSAKESEEKKKKQHPIPPTLKPLK